MSSEEEKRIDVETPTLDSEVRIGWRHHRNYKDYFMDLTEMLIKLKIARKNATCNWTFNEMATVDDDLQGYLVHLIRSEPGFGI